MTRRGKRSKSARKRRNQRPRTKKTTFDQKTGEVLNLQEHYIRFEIVPKDLGFLNVDTSQFNAIGSMFLHEGEVLINRRGTGTIQVRPEVFV